MAYTLANSTAKNSIFNTDGNAIAVQPNLTTSTLAGVRDAALTRNPSDYGFVSNVPQVVYTGYDDTSILQGSSNVIRDAANTALRSPAADKGDREGIMKMESLRTNKVKTSIRNGDWVAYSGQFSSAPATANDFSAVGSDHESIVDRDTRGAFAFAYHKTITQENYPNKTQ